MLGRHSRQALGLLSLALTGCPSASVPPPALPDTPKQTQDVAQGHLLLHPVSDADQLLGRAVQTTPDGAWSIADARASGCEVQVRHERAEYETRRRVDVHSMTELAGGFAALVGLEAKFGHATRADIDIANTGIVRADVRGDCGDTVVDQVYVGHGTRKLLTEAVSAAKAGLRLGNVTPSGGYDTGTQVVDETAWKTDQGYAFTFTKVASEPSVDLKIDLAPTLHEGDAVTVSFEASRPAWLVVYYLEEDGKGEVLWPSDDEPEPKIEPGRPTTFPSDRERAAGIAVKAALRTKGKAARETLVAYAFADKADWLRVKPKVGSSGGAAIAAEMTKRLEAIPLRRWSRAVSGYLIAPLGNR